MSHTPYRNVRNNAPAINAPAAAADKPAKKPSTRAAKRKTK